MEQKKIPDQEELELKKIARGIHFGAIFTDRHFATVRDAEQLSNMVFLPLALGAFKDYSKDELNDIGLIFEYMDQAGPRGINGYPIFTSFRILNKKQTKIVFEYVKKLKKACDSL